MNTLTDKATTHDQTSGALSSNSYHHPSLPDQEFSLRRTADTKLRSDGAPQAFFLDAVCRPTLKGYAVSYLVSEEYIIKERHTAAFSYMHL